MISLIATVKNERATLPAWFDSLLAQSVAPDEIVIVDGGSDDGTWEWLQEKADAYTHLVVAQKEGNISVGRNEAIRVAAGELIVVADAGCTYDARWFQEISAPLKNGSTFVTTAFAPLLTTKTTLVSTLIAAATTPRSVEFDKDWLASSRSVAFKKSLWQTVGTYPEWLPICEDIVFDLNVLREKTDITYIRTPLVSWAPRPSIGAYMKQLFRYTRGDGHAHLFFSRQMIRYAVYGGLVAVLALATVHSTWWLLLPLAAPLYLFKFYARFISYWGHLSAVARIAGLLILPVIIALGDIAKMAGWPVGRWQRMRGIIAPPQ